jgi:DNA-binding NarL/FixJ family response regulator
MDLPENDLTTAPTLPYRLGIIEDTLLIRQLFAEYFAQQPEFALVQQCDSAEDYLRQPRTPLDVLVLDIGLPGESGLQLLPRLKQMHPATEIIMFTVYQDIDNIFEALCLGATGYLLKSTPMPQIKDLIINQMQGGAAMSPLIARKVIAHFGQRRPAPKPRLQPDPAEGLSEKERAIVLAIVDGLSYKLVADRVGLSIDTVRYHIKNIYRKLQVNSKAELISMQLRG